LISWLALNLGRQPINVLDFKKLPWKQC
jgi:hypothetical protein